jgi:hypothetical protein
MLSKTLLPHRLNIHNAHPANKADPVLVLFLLLLLLPLIPKRIDENRSKDLNEQNDNQQMLDEIEEKPVRVRVEVVIPPVCVSHGAVQIALNPAVVLKIRKSRSYLEREVYRVNKTPVERIALIFLIIVLYPRFVRPDRKEIEADNGQIERQHQGQKRGLDRHHNAVQCR